MKFEARRGCLRVVALAIFALAVSGFAPPARKHVAISSRPSAFLQPRSTVSVTRAVVARESSSGKVVKIDEVAGETTVVLVDGDNVRGKSGFALSKQQLLDKVAKWASPSVSVVLFFDHGLRSEALAQDNNLTVVFSGDRSADDAIARDVSYLLGDNDDSGWFSRLHVITSDSGLATRCRKNARGRGGPRRLTLHSSIGFLASLPLIPTTKEAVEDAVDAEVVGILAKIGGEIASKTTFESLERAENKRAKVSRSARKKERETYSKLMAEEALFHSRDEAGDREAQLARYAAVATEATLEAAILKSGGGVFIEREQTWERCLRAAWLHSRLQPRAASEDKWMGAYAEHVLLNAQPRKKKITEEPKGNKRSNQKAVLLRRSTTVEKKKVRTETLAEASRRWGLRGTKTAAKRRRFATKDSKPRETWPGGVELGVEGSSDDDHEDKILKLEVGGDSVRYDLAMVSDTHGFQDSIGVLPPGDLLIHAGDFALDSGNRVLDKRSLREFDAWLQSQPHRHKVVLRGNHDPKAAFFQDARYITAAEVMELDVGNDRPLRLLLAPHGSYRTLHQVPDVWDNIDVIVSHAPPAGVLDLTYQGEHAGSKPLRLGLENMDNEQEQEQPALWVCGHIHEAAGATTISLTDQRKNNNRVTQRRKTVLVNAATANDGKAKHLVRKAVLATLNLAPKDAKKQEEVVEVDDSEEVLELLAIDLGLRCVGCATFSGEGELAGYAAREEDFTDEALVAAARAAGAHKATHVVCEGSDAALRSEALAALKAAGLMSPKAIAAPLVDARHWRLGLLLPKERKSGAEAKAAARTIAKHILATQSAEDFQQDEVLNTDAAEAICLGAWATRQLGWTDTPIVKRFSNGNVIPGPTKKNEKTLATLSAKV